MRYLLHIPTGYLVYFALVDHKYRPSSKGCFYLYYIGDSKNCFARSKEFDLCYYSITPRRDFREYDSLEKLLREIKLGSKLLPEEFMMIESEASLCNMTISIN